MSTSKNDKIPPIPTGKHVSSARKESLSTLRRSNSASQLHNDHSQIEANLTEKNRIMATEVDRLKCLVQEKNNRILELDDENYQFRDYINRLELESSRLKNEYDDLKSENTQLKFQIEKLKHDYDELVESKNSTPPLAVENGDEQQEGMSRFFKYAERIFADVTKMMKYKKYVNPSLLNLPNSSRPSILSTSLSNQTSLSNSFRASTRSSRRSSLLIHENNRKSKEECLPVSLTTAIERDEIEEKSLCQEKTIEQDESMREEEEDEEVEEEEGVEEPDVIPDTQPSNSSEGLQAIEEESEYEEVEEEEEEDEEEELEEEDEEETEEEEEEEEEEEDEETEEIIEVEETVEATELDEDEEKQEETQIAQETIKNHTYLINETHQFGDKTFNIPVKTPEPLKRTVKFDCSLEEASFHTKYAKTPIRPIGKSVLQEDDSLIEEPTKTKKKSILKVRTSDPIEPHKNPESLLSQANVRHEEKEQEQIQKSIFKTKRDTPTKRTNEVNQYLEDLVEQAAETDKENRKNSRKTAKESPRKGRPSKSKKYFDDSETASDSNDEDFEPKKNTKKKVDVKKSALPPRPEKTKQEKITQEKSALPPLPAKKPKRPIENVYEPKQVLKQTQNLTNRKNSVGSEKESIYNDSVNSSANNLSPNINNLLSKKLRLSPDSEDSNDHSGYFPGETGSARRARKAVSYKEIPLNAKIRRDKDNKICVKNLKSNSANPNEDLVR